MLGAGSSVEIVSTLCHISMLPPSRRQEKRKRPQGISYRLQKLLPESNTCHIHSHFKPQQVWLRVNHRGRDAHAPPSLHFEMQKQRQHPLIPGRPSLPAAPLLPALFPESLALLTHGHRASPTHFRRHVERDDLGMTHTGPQI